MKTHQIVKLNKNPLAILNGILKDNVLKRCWGKAWIYGWKTPASE